MADIGTGYIRIAPNMSGIQGKIASGMKGAGTKATQQLGSEVNKSSGPFQSAIAKLGGIAKVGGLAVATGLGVGLAAVAGLTTKMLLSQAALEQALGGSEAVFGKYAKNIQTVADSAFKNMGLSQNEFLAGANKMGSLYQGAGITVQKSMDMSAKSIQRATDVASIMGIDTTTALESVTAMAKGNFTMMDNLGVAMNDTALNAYALEKGLSKTTAQMSMGEKVGLATQLFMEKTAKYAGNYAKENETLSGSINTTKKAFDDFLSGGGDIGNFIDSLIKTIGIAVPQIVNILPKIVTGLGQTLSQLAPVVAKVLPKLLPALIGAVGGLLNSIVKELPTLVKVIVTALPLFIKAFVEIFLGLVKALPQIVQILADAIPQVIDAIVNGLTNPEALTAIILGAVALLLAIVKAIPIIITSLVAALPVIYKNIVKTLTSPVFIGAMIKAGVELIKAIIKGLVSIQSSIVKAAVSILKTVAGVLSPNSMYSIGTALVKGLWNGIQSLGGWLKDNIIKFISDKLPGPVKKVLGIQSPSKVFAEIGRNVGAGMAVGINSSAGLVGKSVTKLTDSALASIASPTINPSVAFGSSSANASGYNSNTNTVQNTTINKVVLGDVPAVKEFFRQLNQDTINVGLGMTPIEGTH